MYRLPAYLVATTLKFNAAAAWSADAVAAAILSNQQAEMRRAVKAEKEELLKFIDSYDFSDLAVEQPASKERVVGAEGDAATEQRIAFSCKLRSRDGGRKLGTESNFLLNNGARAFVRKNAGCINDVCVRALFPHCPFVVRLVTCSCAHVLAPLSARGVQWWSSRRRPSSKK